jgi:hypothetical protein
MERHRGSHRIALAAGLLAILLFEAAGAAEREPGVPVHNDPHLKSPPPPPAAGRAAERAGLLVKAIRENKPELATPFFFPREAFRRVKAIKSPDRYFRRLLELYRGDVLELRRGLAHPDRVELVGFRLSRRVHWTPRGSETNALPYWDAYGSEVIVRDGGRTRALRVRVMITWNDEWYVTHLTRMK